MSCSGVILWYVHANTCLLYLSNTAACVCEQLPFCLILEYMLFFHFDLVLIAQSLAIMWTIRVRNSIPSYRPGMLVQSVLYICKHMTVDQSDAHTEALVKPCRFKTKLVDLFRIHINRSEGCMATTVQCLFIIRLDRIRGVCKCVSTALRMSISRQ